MREALRRGMGEVSFAETRDEFQRQARRRGVPDRAGPEAQFRP